MRRPFLAVMACLTLAIPLRAQQQQGTPSSSEYKDPNTATLLSVVVIGGGQFYSGDTQKGAMLLGVGYGSIILGEAIGVAACSGGGSCGAGAAALLAGVGVGVGTWIYGIMDASNAAERHNASIGKSRTASVAPVVLPDGNRGKERVGLGLTLRF